MPELTLISAALIGWLGGVHCLGMCGGIVSALALSAPETGRAKILLAYNLVAMGLYLLGFPWLVRPLEQAGHNLWRRVEPVSRRLFPVNTMSRALAVGLLWGFLPCGLVYSALATAFALGSAVQGSLWMGAFALGTLPNLLMAGWVGAQTLQQLRNSAWRWLGGLLVTGWGIYGLVRLWMMD